MHMLYNSDSYSVVAFDLPTLGGAGVAGASTVRGGFEIVDKFAKKDIFIEGALAESFKAGAQALMAGQPSEEDIDDYISGYTVIGSQPLVLH
ncbi:MAG: DUF3567 domain-containing protein [Pseudomonadota bacterium]|nr:DUF3567 domain-containing protein [Pseudomonadota bacterium]